ncbi:MAG: hypothetical protein SOX82_12160 [Eubacteriales bacterium]|nr:hypothetical protein [Eubacteriales bacterium]
MKTNFKKNVGKKLSRILSAATAALMLVVSIPQASLAAIPTDNVINNLNGKTYNVNSTNYTEIGIGSTYSATGVIVDFDFTIPNLDDTYELMPRTYRGGGTSDTHVWFNKGKICIEQVEGTTWYGNDEKIVTNPGGNTNSEASYQANQTRHMTMVYDENGNPNGAAGEKFTIDYYIDGEYVCTLNTPSQKNGSTTNKLQNMFFRASKITAGTQMTVSNFTVRDANKYPNLEYDAPTVDESGVKIKFSETLACANTADYTSGNDLSGIKIKSIDGEAVEGVSATIKNETLSLTYTGSLKSDKTYYVILPKNFKSVDEKVLVDNTIAFKAPAAKGVDATLYTQDFESATDSKLPSGLGSSDVDTKEYKTVDATHNKAWLLNGDYTGIKYVRCLPVNDANIDLSDEIVVSADFYLNQLKRTADIMVQQESGNKKIGFCFFDAAGHFVAVKDKAHAWSTDETVAASNNTYIVANTPIEAKKWYTVKMVINKVDRTVTYYLGADGAWETVGTVPILQDPAVVNDENPYIVFNELRLQGWQKIVNDVTTRPYGDFYMDNIKIGYQNINITPANIIATSENTITYNFSADENKLNDKYVLDANVKFVEAGKPIYFRCNDNKNSDSGLLFCADADGNLSMSKSLLNWKNDEFMRDLGVKSELNKLVNIKLLVDKTRTKPVTVFINNKYVRNLALGWGNEPNNADYLIDNPGAANFIKGDGNTSPNTVDSVSIGNMTANVPESITLTDSANKIYSIYTDGIPADIGSVSLNYANAFADSTDVSGATLNKKGEDGALTVVSGYAAALSTDKKSIVISKTDGVLENGTYTISVIGVTGADNFTTDFVVNDTRGFVINSFSVAKDEDKYYPSITATNYGVSQKSITVLICEYTKDAIPQLVNADVKPITLNGGASTTIGKNDISLTTTRTDTTIKAFIWSALGENKPIVNAQTYTAPVTE